MVPASLRLRPAINNDSPNGLVAVIQAPMPETPRLFAAKQWTLKRLETTGIGVGSFRKKRGISIWKPFVSAVPPKEYTQSIWRQSFWQVSALLADQSVDYLFLHLPQIHGRFSPLRALALSKNDLYNEAISVHKQRLENFGNDRLVQAGFGLQAKLHVQSKQPMEK